MAIKIGDAVLMIGADTSKLDKSLKSMGDKMTRVGKQMSMKLTLPLVAFGGLAIKTAATYSRAMAKVAAVTGATAEEFETLNGLAKELGRTTQFTASQVAEAMSFMGMAGMTTEQIMASLADTLNLAAAGGLDMASAANIVTNILAGFGMETEDLGNAVDVLAKAFTSSNTDLTMLGESMKFAGPVAKGFGLTFEETAAIMGIFGNAGIQASLAGTSLRGAIVQLNNKAEEFGITMFDSAGKMIPMVDILEQLEERGFTAGQMMDLFGLRAGPAMTALLEKGSKALRDFTDDLETAGGTAEQIAEKQMEGLHGVLIRLKSAFEGLQLAIAEQLVPFFAPLVEKLTELFRKFAALPEPVRRLSVVVGILAGAIGPLLLVLGKLISLAPFVGAALQTILGPIGLINIAIGGLVLALGFLVKAMVGPQAKIEDWVEALREAEEELTALEESGHGMSEEANNLREQIDRLNDALETHNKLVKEGAVTEWNLVDALAERTRITERIAERQEKLNFLLAQTGGELHREGTAYGRLNQRIQQEQTLIANLTTEYRDLTDEIKTQIDSMDDLTKIYEKAPDDIRRYIDAFTLEDITEKIDKQLKALNSTFEEAREVEREGERIAADNRIDDLRNLYGVLEDQDEDYTETKMELARKARRQRERDLDDEMADARSAHIEKLRMLDDEYRADLSLVDDKTRTAIKALQDEIDAIDAAEDKEERQRRDRANALKTRELRAALESAETEEERADAIAALNKWLTQLEMERVQDEREDRKAALRDQIDTIRDQAQLKRDQLADELRAEKQHQTDMLNETLQRLQDEKDGLDKALKAELLRIEEERVSYEQAEADKLTATQSRLDREEKILKKFHDDEMQRIAERLRAAEGTLPALVPAPPARLPRLTEYAHGGPILGPTVLTSLRTMRPYAVAGERGPEFVTPAGGFKTANIMVMLDRQVLAEALGQPLVDDIRLKGAVKI